jgi:hypothetical protein
MNALRIAGIPAMVVLCVAMAVAQDASHDVDVSQLMGGARLIVRRRASN